MTCAERTCRLHSNFCLQTSGCVLVAVRETPEREEESVK